MRRFYGYNGNNYCCDMRGMLGFLILFLLSKKPMHGQEIADEIARRKGEKPSPGTIYPALKNLREMGSISSEDEKEGKTITYTLTERGQNALRISKRRFIRIFLESFLRANQKQATTQRTPSARSLNSIT